MRLYIPTRVPKSKVTIGTWTHGPPAFFQKAKHLCYRQRPFIWILAPRSNWLESLGVLCPKLLEAVESFVCRLVVIGKGSEQLLALKDKWTCIRNYPFKLIGNYQSSQFPISSFRSGNVCDVLPRRLLRRRLQQPTWQRVPDLPGDSPLRFFILWMHQRLTLGFESSLPCLTLLTMGCLS